MKQTTKKQHYIWRAYLAPWTDDNSSRGKIWCLRNNKIFSVGLMNVAHENYFYGVRELSRFERTALYNIFVAPVSGTQREINKGWLDF